MTYNSFRLLEEINDSLQRQPRLTLRELEKRLGVGPHTIEKAVRSATGMCFREYQAAKVLTEASRLLRGTNLLQIKQIAVALGYVNTKSFSRYFKAQTGMTPSEFIATSGPCNESLPSR